MYLPSAEKSENLEPQGKKVNTNKMIEVRITKMVCGVRVFYTADWINSIRFDGCHLFVRSFTRALARGRPKNSWLDSVIVSCVPSSHCLSHGLLIW